MPKNPSPALPIRAAMDASSPLAGLMERLHESRDRFEAIASRLPPALRASVQPGPVDDEGWSLLVANASAAAKLRHLLPLLEDTLHAGGFSARPIRVKILTPR
ncbi:hypothetical protein [Ideonella sp. BN130291]|uniref:hypothetical protein n=1 Tax=Ideonella sp. BN130291 TaxID=3112940 RepID=UPI002E2748AD|nr:hypothetical protein [Ideonella sp. BN130291]